MSINFLNLLCMGFETTLFRKQREKKEFAVPQGDYDAQTVLEGLSLFVNSGLARNNEVNPDAFNTLHELLKRTPEQINDTGVFLELIVEEMNRLGGGEEVEKAFEKFKRHILSKQTTENLQKVA